MSVRRPCRRCAASRSSRGRSWGDGEFEPELARREQAVAHAGEIARAAASEAEAGEGAGKIRRALENAPHAVAQVAVLDEKRDGIVPVADACPDG